MKAKPHFLPLNWSAGMNESTICPALQNITWERHLFWQIEKQRGRKNCPLALADELGEGQILVWAGPNPPCRFCWQSYSCFVSVLPPFLFLTLWQLKQNINCLHSWDYTNETREKITKSHRDRHSCFVINTWTQTFSQTSLVLGGHPNGSQA